MLRLQYYSSGIMDRSARLTENTHVGWLHSRPIRAEHIFQTCLKCIIGLLLGVPIFIPWWPLWKTCVRWGRGLKKNERWFTVSAQDGITLLAFSYPHRWTERWWSLPPPASWPSWMHVCRNSSATWGYVWIVVQCF